MAIYVKAGAPAYVVVNWKNKGAASYAPSFRLDLRRSGALAGWTEGLVLKVSSAQPGMVVSDVIYCQVPPGWSGDPSVDWKLHVIGIKPPVASGTGGFAIL